MPYHRFAASEICLIPQIQSQITPHNHRNKAISFLFIPFNDSFNWVGLVYFIMYYFFFNYFAYFTRKLGLPAIKMLTTKETNEPDLIVMSFIIFTKIQIINVHLHEIRDYDP